MKTHNKPTVKSLRAAGHLVKVTHLRRVSVSKKAVSSLLKPKYQHIAKGAFTLPAIAVELPQVVLSKGGETQLTVDLKSGGHYQVNTICSRREVYNKKKALKVCCDRLYSQMCQNGDV